MRARAPGRVSAPGPGLRLDLFSLLLNFAPTPDLLPVDISLRFLSFLLFRLHFDLFGKFLLFLG